MAESEPFSWTDYYRATAGRAPRPLFLRALGRLNGDDGAGRAAVDLGCGDGTETSHLLARGWRVHAVDQTPEGIDRLRSRIAPEHEERLTPVVSAFDAFVFPPSDFVYAGYSLFFCPPATFPAVWARLRASLRPGGRVAAHFLGERDTWAADPALTFHTRAALSELLSGLDVEAWDEEENDRPAVSGPKHWHVHEIVARTP